MNKYKPNYLELFKSGELKKRTDKAKKQLDDCNFCPHLCGSNRLNNEFGFCKGGKKTRVYSYSPHMGEEDPLRGTSGSGTIFFGRCNLHCIFCQNSDISQSNSGTEIEASQLADIMLDLQNLDCHNINLVSPSHFIPQILEALLFAVQRGLCLPLVYNSGGYDSADILKEILDGVIDIYMPDMKYGSQKNGKKYSKVKNYPQVNFKAVKEMHRQVGDLSLDERGIARRGLLVRHLVLPQNLANSFTVFEFLAQQISKNTYLNIMTQYHPAHKAHYYPELNRCITRDEYIEAVKMARKLGLKRLD